jgi:dephospho-CoA kinase
VITIVLTGGIASGKTAVSDCFARLGVPVIDTDLIAREVVKPGQPALERIVEVFGGDFLDPEGQLDRQKMRQAIFSDPDQKARLEAILHPLIAEEVTRRVKKLNRPYCILVIPLYAQSSAYFWIDRVLVVDVAEKVQIERVMARDQISRNQAKSILSAQTSRETRLALADDIIDNSGSLDELQDKVEALHKKYLKLAVSG